MQPTLTLECGLLYRLCAHIARSQTEDDWSGDEIRLGLNNTRTVYGICINEPHPTWWDIDYLCSIAIGHTDIV